MDRSSLLILAVLFLIGVFDAQAFMRMPQRASYRTLQGKAGGVCKSLQTVSRPLTRMSAADAYGDEEDDIDHFTRARIEELIKENKIVLFMKGNKLFPSCGFSNTAVRILDEMRVPFETVDVLADERMRAEIKRYSQWPTIPMLYVQGELVGGSDIMLEMYQSGELQELIEIAAAS